MKKVTIALIALLLLGGTLACGIAPQVPDIEVPDIKVPTLEVGEMRDKREAIPLAGIESAAVEVAFGTGELELEAGVSNDLFSGHFRYNVEQWTPQVTHEDGVLTIKQGKIEKEEWGVPTGLARNEWKLEFTPEIPLEMDVKVGAGGGELDFTGLQLAALDLDVGAGDFIIRFDEPNKVEMSHLSLDAGASKLEMMGIGHVSPERMKVQGGVGDITLDFTGAWTRSAEVQITAGVGSVNLRLPDDVGVQVETRGGLSNVEASGLKRVDDTYINDAFDEVETELRVHITTGVGGVHLVEVSN